MTTVELEQKLQIELGTVWRSMQALEGPAGYVRAECRERYQSLFRRLKELQARMKLVKSECVA
jgi:hypothetical protein